MELRVHRPIPIPALEFRAVGIMTATHGDAARIK